MTEKLFIEITDWQKRTFPSSTSLSKLAHLKEEIEELETDIFHNHGNAFVKLEFADCFILLLGSAASFGLTYQDIINAIEEKMQINYKRKWGVAKENGVVNHIEED